jgi:hypothetical protein
VLVAIWEGQEKKLSLRRIQQSLEDKGFIRPMSPQAFYKYAKRLLGLKGCAGPFYNELALPQKPETISDFVKDAWDKAEANLRVVRNSTIEDQLTIDEQVKSEIEMELQK